MNRTIAVVIGAGLAGTSMGFVVGGDAGGTLGVVMGVITGLAWRYWELVRP